MLNHLILFLFIFILSGCQRLIELFPIHSTKPVENQSAIADSEVRQLLLGKQIDALTQYVEKYQDDKTKFEQVRSIRKEREKRCKEAAQHSEKLEKNRVQLAKLRGEYQRSCPQIVNNFTIAVESTESSEILKDDAEIQTLLSQKRIDLLTQYLEKYKNDKTKSNQLQQVKAERDKRCKHIETQYRQQEKNPTHLANLKKEYQRSCPQIVEQFAQEVAKTEEKQTTTPPSSAASKICEDAFEKENYDQAFQQCKTLAEQGHASAQHKLGYIYEKGKGTPSDEKQALQWYQRAAEQGFSKAQLLIGRRFYTGDGVEKDFSQAVSWYRKAAEQGDAEAQYILGVMYELGQGVPQDFVVAYQFFLLSAAKGYENAVTARDKMTPQLSSEQLAEGQRLAREWTRKKGISKDK